MMTLRSLEDRDRSALLGINAASWPAVTRINSDELNTLLSFQGAHWVVEEPATGRMVGYLLSFSSSSAYDDEEIRAFRARIEQPFLYICQVALVPEYHRQGLGRRLYHAANREAQQRDFRLICAEVNSDPINEASLHFHLAQGFQPLDEIAVSYGFRVLLLTRSVGESDSEAD